MKCIEIASRSTTEAISPNAQWAGIILRVAAPYDSPRAEIHHLRPQADVPSVQSGGKMLKYIWIWGSVTNQQLNTQQDDKAGRRCDARRNHREPGRQAAPSLLAPGIHVVRLH